MTHERSGRLLTVNEACSVVQVSRRTIYNWLAAGKLDYLRVAGGGVRIYEDSLWRDERGHLRYKAKVS